MLLSFLQKMMIHGAEQNGENISKISEQVKTFLQFQLRLIEEECQRKVLLSLKLPLLHTGTHYFRILNTFFWFVLLSIES